MISIIRIESKISKRKLQCLLKQYDKVLIFSEFKIKGISYTNKVCDLKTLLKTYQYVNLVSQNFSDYIKILKEFNIKEIRVIKKSKKIKKIEFLTYDQMEMLQLYFEFLNNKELQYAKSKNISLIMDYKYTIYSVSSFEKNKVINTIVRKKNELIFYGDNNIENITNILVRCKRIVKKIRIKEDSFKIKISKNKTLFLSFLRSNY